MVYIASKQAQLVPKMNLSNGKSIMLVGCGYKDELKYNSTNVLVANLRPLFSG